MIKSISKYRGAVMGIAILWIMLHHSGLNLPNPLFALKRTGYIGVEMFLFVSGLGCAYSLKNNDDTFAFYFRRIKRIYPHFIPILILFLVLETSEFSVLECLRSMVGNITGFSFWASEGLRFNWYMPAIILFYGLTPLFFKSILRYNIKGLIYLLIIAFAALFCFARNSELIIAISRFPIFILGIYAGIKECQDSDKNFDMRLTIFIYFMGVLGVLSLGLLHKYKDTIPSELYKVNVFIPCIPISLAIIVVSIKLFELIDNYSLGSKFISLFGKLGRVSLDLYLIHIVLFSKVGMYIEGSFDKEKPHPFILKNCIVWVVIFIATIIVAFVYDKIISLIIISFERKMERRSRSY